MAENRRVKMTKKMMKDALLELLEKQPIEKITVTDICEKADVNRSTFILIMRILVNFFWKSKTMF